MLLQAGHALCAAFACPLIPEGLINGLLPVEAEVLSIDREMVTLEVPPDAELRKGDLFSVFYPCKDKKDKTSPCVSALLSVQSHDKEYLYANIIEAAEPGELKPGCTAIRFASLTGGIVDKRAHDKADTAVSSVEMDFAESLPQIRWRTLTWVGNGQEEQFMEKNSLDLLIVLRESNLEMYLKGQSVPRNYPLTGNSLSETTPSMNAHIVSHGDFRLSRPLKVGSMPLKAVDIKIRDINGDGREEIITLTGGSLTVSPYRRGGPALSARINGGGRLINCSASDHDGWIVVNRVLDGYGLSSILFKLEEDKLKVIRDDINLWLCFRHLGSGKEMSLVGQPWKGTPADVTGFFYILRPGAHGISYEERTGLPGAFPIINSFKARFTGYEEPLLCAFDKEGIMHIFRRNRLLWSALEGQRAFVSSTGPGVSRVNASIFRKGRLSDLLIYQSASPGGISLSGVDGNGFFVQTDPLDTGEFRIMDVDGQNDKIFLSVEKSDGVHVETLLYEVNVIFESDQ